MLLAAIAGALAGGLILYAVAAAHPAAAVAAVEAVPFVHRTMTARVAYDYRRQGPWAILFGPGNGIPYKVYAALAPPVADPVSFALLSIPARLERFLPACLIFTVAGRGFRRRIASHPRRATLAFAVLWTVGYAVYWSVI